MLRIGLTGGYGCGKSTAAKQFLALGVPVIDADHLARELVAPNQPAYLEIVAAFGNQILTTTGQLNRELLRQRIFANSFERVKLEAILHPRIRSAMQVQWQTFKSVPYCVLEIPLLFESGQTDLCHRIAVVDVAEELQIERVRCRNGYSIAEIRAVLNSQWQRSMRLAIADDIIDNSSDVIHLISQINSLHPKYLSYCSSILNHIHTNSGGVLC